MIEDMSVRKFCEKAKHDYAILCSSRHQRDIVAGQLFAYHGFFLKRR
jgi:hypothetical protein